MEIQRLNTNSNFKKIADSIIPSEWDELNDFSTVSATALKEIADRKEYFFLMALVEEKIVGTLLAVQLRKIDGSHWIYVDELDTHPKYRRQGIASALMKELFEMAKKEKAVEIWLGTEKENLGANSFYKSLNPSEVSDVNGYLYITKDIN